MFLGFSKSVRGQEEFPEMSVKFISSTISIDGYDSEKYGNLPTQHLSIGDIFPTTKIILRIKRSSKYCMMIGIFI